VSKQEPEDDWTKRVYDMLATKRNVMAYPWSQIPPQYQRLLLSGGTPDQAVDRVIQIYQSSGGRKREAAIEASMRRLLRAVSVWGRSKRRFIRVSAASQETLFRVAVERAMYGLPVCHWNYLSAPGGEVVEYGEGLMFQWEGMTEGQGDSVITFASPRGVFLGEHLEFAWWRLVPADAAWWSQGFAYVWECVDMPYYVHRLDYEDEVARKMLELRESYEKMGTPITREEAAMTILSQTPYKLVHMTVNLIAALHNFSSETIKSEKEASINASTKKQSPFKAITSINLDDTGLQTWARRWCTESVQREGAGGPGSEGTPHGPVTLHERKGHLFHVWVLRENVRPGEKILEVRHFDAVQRCKVYRPRSGSVVGSGALKGDEIRIRRGPDDIISSLSVHPKPKE